MIKAGMEPDEVIYTSLLNGYSVIGANKGRLLYF
jgi:hypothetical protein